MSFKQILTNIFYFHPLQSELFILLLSLILSFLLSIFGARKIFKEIKSRSVRLARNLSFIFYLLLFFYFFNIFLILPRAIFEDLKIDEYLINRLSYSLKDYIFIPLVSLFLIGGLIYLIFSFKKETSVDSSQSKRSLAYSLWRGIRVSLIWIVLLLIAFVSLRAPILSKKDLAVKEIEKIRATKITLDDVLGKNLPPAPDPKLVNATIQGVDANKNGIRDDVELAIFEKYPDSARIRAALLQYALSLQLEITEKLITPETVTAIVEEGDRAPACLAEVFKDYFKNSDGNQNTQQNDDAEINKLYNLWKETINFVEDLQFNTQERIKAEDEFYHGNLRTYGESPVNKQDCDIDLASLPN